MPGTFQSQVKGAVESVHRMFPSTEKATFTLPLSSDASAAIVTVERGLTNEPSVGVIIVRLGGVVSPEGEIAAVGTGVFVGCFLP